MLETDYGGADDSSRGSSSSSSSQTATVTLTRRCQRSAFPSEDSFLCTDIELCSDIIFHDKVLVTKDKIFFLKQRCKEI